MEELADKIRPFRRFADGLTVVLRDLPLEQAREIQQAKRERRSPPSAAEFRGDGPPDPVDAGMPQVVGGLDKKTFFGSVDRVHINSNATYPNRTVVRINGPRNCSGFVIGPTTVVTAAHCIYNRPEDTGGDGEVWPTEVVPALDGTPTWIPRPNGTWTAGYIEAMWGYQSIPNGGNVKDYDVGIIETYNEYGYAHPGWMGYGDFQWDNNYMWAQGYPWDKQFTPTNNWNEQWGTYNCSILGNEGACWKTDCDVTNQNSGGPLYHYSNGGYKIVGIITGLYNTFNTARSWDYTVWTFVRDWTTAW